MLLAVVLWAVLVVAGTVGGWWHQRLAPAGDDATFLSAAKQMIESRNRGNVAFALIEHAVPSDEYFVSVGDVVGPQTLFQVASLSKWITAWAVMTLVESGKVELDAPVSRYLTRWQLPPSEFDNDGVTVRRLLSHTAGLRDYMELMDLAGMPLAGLDEAGAMSTVAAQRDLDFPPGTSYSYSNSGYLMAAAIVRRITGESLTDFAASRPFIADSVRFNLWTCRHKPIWLTRTTVCSPKMAHIIAVKRVSARNVLLRSWQGGVTR